MQNDKTRHVNIGHALALNSDPESIIPYYAKWSETYDEDVIEGYVGIALISDLLHQHVQSAKCQLTNKDPSVVNIADVGCGTGLGGKSLAELGYTHIDGLDLSPEMIEKARASGWYTGLHHGVNINEPLPVTFQNSYDATVCLGTFTPGHVLPEALCQLVQMTRPHGIVVVSTRPEYYDTTAFQSVSDNLESDSLARLIHCYKDAPYRNDGHAHYWVYEVLA
ncbi:MAG: class I SAM-dependent DNA methyltransferase [Leucothrix sp.]